jgi:hypothetical protein
VTIDYKIQDNVQWILATNNLARLLYYL